VVERLVANEKVASSTLVTRSSPESFRGWSERAEPMRRRAAPKKPSYGWQAGLRHVLRYLLKSESYPRQPYVGSTSNLKQRLKEHNEGRSPHTAKFHPWILVTYFAFANEKTANSFEKYLKSGSGRAFVNRHFI
jgi:putative endonuclease